MKTPLGWITARLVHADAFAILFLAAWPFVYFGQITLAQGVWFGTDIIRLFHPFGVELSRALNEGRLPLWTTGIQAGFPLLAESQVGALYPLNLILFRLLPAHFALSYSVLLHLAWAGCGMYVCARAWGLRAASALLAGFVLSFNGFILAQLIHPAIVVTSSWLSWLIFFQDRFQRARNQKSTRAGIWFFLAAVSIGIQFLCGSVQIAFLNVLAFALFGFFGGRLWMGGTTPPMSRRVLRVALWTMLPLILGVGIAAIQLVPTGELIGYSVRSTVAQSFVTSYSLPPAFLAQFVVPFAQGEPSEQNNEYWGYIGLAPLLLAVMAPLLRRDRQTIFLSLFALGTLSLALGELNPVYQLLYRLPGFGFFRVPARYLFLFVFAAAMLGATVFDELSSRLTPVSSKRAIPWVTVFAALTFLTLWLARTQSLEFWLQVWQVLPWLLALFGVAAIALARARWIDRVTFQAMILGAAIFDLAAFAPPFIATIDWIYPPSYVTSAPRSLPALGSGRERVFTDQSDFPSVPAIRASLYPNTALVYGKESAQIWSSLAMQRHDAFTFSPSPTMLNLLNVRYFLVPLEPRRETKPATPTDVVSLDIVNNEAVIAPTGARAIEITAFTEQAASLPDGTVVGEVVVRFSDGVIETFPVRLGTETADWDYERKRAQGAIQHSRARVARSFPAFWRAFGRTFEGHTYSARYEFTRLPREVIGVNVRALLPNARLTVERARLIGDQGGVVSLAQLTGKNDFSLAFMSDTVAVWENHDRLPRAFIVHAAEVVSDDVALARLHQSEFRAERTVLLSEGEALRESAYASQARAAVEITNYAPEQVELVVTTERTGYLVLADSWYPGWNAYVDGHLTAIQRAHILFRAVKVEPGQHTVRFEYRPWSFVLGAALSAVSLLAAAGVAFAVKTTGQSGN